MAAAIWHGAENGTDRFHLVRYFTVTGLVALLVVGAALYYFERRESDYFRQVQLEQLGFVKQLHESFARQHDKSARRDLLLAHESEHVNLTRLLANALWDSHLARFLARAQQLFGRCYQLDLADPGAPVACHETARQGIIASPELRALDAKLAETMSGTSVFKIKIFDEQGMTIYSSEHRQIGEDKRDNAGWISAIDGTAASELTHRDKFSAFEGVVEDRDLISSYVPLLGQNEKTRIGVFEIYSDVTPLLAKINSTSAEIAAVASENQAKFEQVAASNQRNVDASSYVLIAIIGSLLAALYVVLLLLSRHAQRIINAQAHAQEISIRREERLYREKMSVLATMAATVGHEIGNPLATITALAEEMAERQAHGTSCGCRADLILEQTRRIAAKTRQMEDFTAARGETVEPVDVNEVVKAVCEFLSFDRRFGTWTIDFRPAPGLPARLIVADHLTETVMNLLQAYMEAAHDDHGADPRRIVVDTRMDGEAVAIRVSCDSDSGSAIPLDAADPRVESARRRVAAMSGTLTLSGSDCEIRLAAGTPSAFQVPPDTRE